MKLGLGHADPLENLELKSKFHELFSELSKLSLFHDLFSELSKLSHAMSMEDCINADFKWNS